MSVSPAAVWLKHSDVWYQILKLFFKLCESQVLEWMDSVQSLSLEVL